MVLSNHMHLFLVKKYIPRYYIYQYLGILFLPETSACVSDQLVDLLNNIFHDFCMCSQKGTWMSDHTTETP
jgi:hypothetical protein